MKLIAFAAAAGLVLTPTSAAAWNARGHMTVAAIAWERMTPLARQRAAALLMLNPDYQEWVRNKPVADHGRIAFMEAATWPDDLRGRTCNSQAPVPGCIRDEGYTPTDANADLNIGYQDRRLRRYWHFKDLPFSTDGTPTEDPFSPDAETQIDAFGQSLRSSNLGDDAKSFNLSWLLHLVGDVHQPLHATARFTASDRDGDAGGNGVVACPPAGTQCRTSGRFRDTLHGLWDNAIGTSASSNSAYAKARALLAQLDTPGGFLTMVVARTDLDAPTATWLTESFELAKMYAYQAPIGPAGGPYYPDGHYRRDAGSISEQQVVIAGLRLANLLNRQLQ